MGESKKSGRHGVSGAHTCDVLGRPSPRPSIPVPLATIVCVKSSARDRAQPSPNKRLRDLAQFVHLVLDFLEVFSPKTCFTAYFYLFEPQKALVLQR